MGFCDIWSEKIKNSIITPWALRFKLNSLNQTCTSLKSIMKSTKTIFLDSFIFIEKKRVENRLWRKSALYGEKVKRWRKRNNSFS
jgi:hypothetical protein